MPGHFSTRLLRQKGWHRSKFPGLDIIAQRFSTFVLISWWLTTGHRNTCLLSLTRSTMLHLLTHTTENQTLQKREPTSSVSLYAPTYVNESQIELRVRLPREIDFSWTFALASKSLACNAASGENLQGQVWSRGTSWKYSRHEQFCHRKNTYLLPQGYASH